jgi:hypothetical protein
MDSVPSEKTRQIQCQCTEQYLHRLGQCSTNFTVFCAERTIIRISKNKFYGADTEKNNNSWQVTEIQTGDHEMSKKHQSLPSWKAIPPSMILAPYGNFSKTKKKDQNQKVLQTFLAPTGSFLSEAADAAAPPMDWTTSAAMSYGEIVWSGRCPSKCHGNVHI